MASVVLVSREEALAHFTQDLRVFIGSIGHQRHAGHYQSLHNKIFEKIKNDGGDIVLSKEEIKRIKKYAYCNDCPSSLQASFKRMRQEILNQRSKH